MCQENDFSRDTPTKTVHFTRHTQRRLGLGSQQKGTYGIRSFFCCSYCFAVLVYGNGNSSNYIALRFFTALTLRLCLGTNFLVFTSVGSPLSLKLRERIILRSFFILKGFVSTSNHALVNFNKRFNELDNNSLF